MAHTQDYIDGLVKQSFLPDELRQKVRDGQPLSLEEARQVVDADIADQQLKGILLEAEKRNKQPTAYKRRITKGSKRIVHSGFTPSKKKRK